MTRVAHSKGARDRHLDALRRRRDWLEQRRIPAARERGVEPSFDLVELGALKWALEICETYGAAFDEVQRELSREDSSR